MAELTTFLMFSGRAEEAMNFYVRVFDDSRVIDVQRYGANEAGAEGSVLVARFSLDGREFMCIDSNVEHEFGFTPAISLFVDCTDEAEIDALFEKLSGAGQILMPLDRYPFADKFGWVSDRFGVSWQLSLN